MFGKLEQVYTNTLEFGIKYIMSPSFLILYKSTNVIITNWKLLGSGTSCAQLWTIDNLQCENRSESFCSEAKPFLTFSMGRLNEPYHNVSIWCIYHTKLNSWYLNWKCTKTQLCSDYDAVGTYNIMVGSYWQNLFARVLV